MQLIGVFRGVLEEVQSGHEVDATISRKRKIDDVADLREDMEAHRERVSHLQDECPTGVISEVDLMTLDIELRPNTFCV